MQPAKIFFQFIAPRFSFFHGEGNHQIGRTICAKYKPKHILILMVNQILKLGC